MEDSIKDGEAKVQTQEPWQARFQFPLYKLFLVTVVYALSFAAYGTSEPWQIGVAVWVGTAWSGWVLAVRTRADLVNSVIAATGAVFGIFFGALFTFGPLSRPIDLGLKEAVLEQVPASIGAIVGAALFAGTSRIVRKPEVKQ